MQVWWSPKANPKCSALVSFPKPRTKQASRVRLGWTKQSPKARDRRRRRPRRGALAPEEDLSPELQNTTTGSSNQEDHETRNSSNQNEPGAKCDQTLDRARTRETEEVEETELAACWKHEIWPEIQGKPRRPKSRPTWVQSPSTTRKPAGDEN